MRMRRARLQDMPALARLHRLVMDVSLAYLPHLHTAEEDAAYFIDQLFPNNEIWMVEQGGIALGYAAHSPGWLNHLYVHPEHQGRGIGERLLDKAKSLNQHLQLWAFQRNDRARGFYERRGFSLEEMTDGRRNEEQEPDAYYVWSRAEANEPVGAHSLVLA